MWFILILIVSHKPRPYGLWSMVKRRVDMKRENNKKLLFGLLLLAILGVFCFGFFFIQNKPTNSGTIEKTKPNLENPVYVVYTNDIHAYINNTITDENKNEIPGLRYSNVAALVKDMKNEGKNVILVDAGDQIQGNVYGGIDKGQSIIKLMNACNYQLSTVGNHEFDYGVDELFKRIGEAKFPYVSCTFHSTTGKNELQSSYIFEVNGVKIAFVGITTPDTVNTSTPAHFKNEKDEYIYTFDGLQAPNDLYESVQKAIDEVKDKADYVIALSHTGISFDETNKKISSIDIIQNTTGFDAFIDGHSHTVVDSKIIKDKTDKDVAYTQTGEYLGNIGIMEISNNGISTKLIDKYDNSDAEVRAIEEEIFDKVQKEMGQKIAALDATLYIYDPSISTRRLVRSQEVNAGDFASDAIYWKINNDLKLDCDVTIINGGGVRKQTEKGDITYLDAKAVEPFGNMICLIEATGQQILDALEMGATVTGLWDDGLDIPAENGGFLQVSGLKYTIDSTIKSSVKTDSDGSFLSVDGDYKVKDVFIYDKNIGKYEPIDLKKTYTIGGINYILRNGGNGLTMFKNNKMIVDYIGQDYMILSDYMKSFKKENDYPLIKSENSPLVNLPGFGLDYENPYGAGRIIIK